MKPYIHKNNSFFKLGAAVSLLSENKDIDPDSAIKSVENSIYSNNHINIYKKFASIFKDIINNFSTDENKIKHIYHLNKIASIKNEDWNEHCEELVDNCIKRAAAVLPLRALSIPIGLSGDLASRAAPVAGILGGGLSWVAEKELAEDDIKTEIIKSRIRQYQKLSAELDKEIEALYSDKQEALNE